MVREAAAEAPIIRFLNALQAGKIDGVVEDLFSTSPLWRGKTVELQAMKAQVTGSVQAYGPVQGYELVQSERLGTSVVRQFYLVRHEKMVTRWEFDLVRTGGGWGVAYFGFEDQVKTWS